ncbi:MAG: hypothetical protein DME19_17545 [Verrucomicrobia bacterium]|nr:MAG: hypothetical protein DME19_17545 [Verrucomicrobiota bacterium]
MARQALGLSVFCPVDSGRTRLLLVVPRAVLNDSLECEIAIEGVWPDNGRGFMRQEIEMR